MKVKFNKNFYKNLEIILQNNNSFSTKIEKIIIDFKANGLNIQNFQKYNLKKLDNDFFRLKIIPYRIILKLESDLLIFDNIFKRKGKSDYKNYIH